MVDEMQSMPGVDYESTLLELGKFEASFILATQSLAKLADLSPTMQDTLLANVGCLAVVQVAAADARQLIGELDRERVGEEDLLSLPVHHCYVRATVDGQRAGRVRDMASAYSTPAETIASQDAEAERPVQEFRDKLEQIEEDDSAKPSANSAAGEATPGKRKWQRWKGEGTPEQAAAGGGSE